MRSRGLFALGAAFVALAVVGCVLIVILVVRGSTKVVSAAQFDHPVPIRSSASARVAAGSARTDIRKVTPTITIPGKGSAPIVGEGIDETGALGVPADVHTVGWDVESAELGAANGSTVLDGHINWAGQGDGFFSNLTSMHPGQRFSTRSETGRVSRWRVRSVKSYLKSSHKLPASLFQPNGPRQLVLISCAGALQTDGHYDHNVVVVATPAT
jgi:hypothetical protein